MSEPQPTIATRTTGASDSDNITTAARQSEAVAASVMKRILAWSFLYTSIRMSLEYYVPAQPTTSSHLLQIMYLLSLILAIGIVKIPLAPWLMALDFGAATTIHVFLFWSSDSPSPQPLPPFHFLTIVYGAYTVLEKFRGPLVLTGITFLSMIYLVEGEFPLERMGFFCHLIPGTRIPVESTTNKLKLPSREEHRQNEAMV
ncbi:hypothetical protein E1B28_005405 [Marasmius oreades]|uniref:Uncharacterized protein n=1 Tax=Marasmius oreades TaxID=181124 RepID=A0A9P7UUI8_9AGAR|nr:uncharacterized protein E1B28_005405 [Marasmius oreades]KAG7094578.1 hypothetical protein E1B28_005405 [Marasmius oreades]